MVVGKVIIGKYFNNTEFSIIKDNNFEAFMREFPICDVAQGQIGYPDFLPKRIPPV